MTKIFAIAIATALVAAPIAVIDAAHAPAQAANYNIKTKCNVNPQTGMRICITTYVKK